LHPLDIFSSGNKPILEIAGAAGIDIVSYNGECVSWRGKNVMAIPVFAEKTVILHRDKIKHFNKT